MDKASRLQINRLRFGFVRDEAAVGRTDDHVPGSPMQQRRDDEDGHCLRLEYNGVILPSGRI